MKNIKDLSKKTWFKVGKWKEPVFLQDVIVAAYLKSKGKSVLAYYPKTYLVAGFKQFMLLSEFNDLKEKIKDELTTNPLKIAKEIKTEVRLAVGNLNSFKPKKLNKNILGQYGDLVAVHASQSLRFIILGYVLEESYSQLLQKNFSLNQKSFSPQSLLAVVALPKKIMPMIAENLSLHQMAIKLKGGKSINQDLYWHAEKFGWMNSICWWDQPFDEQHYFLAAKQLVLGNPKKELARIIQTRKKQNQKANAILKVLKKKYPIAWQYIDIIRSLADLREESWDAVSQAGVRLRPLFSALAAKHGLSYNQLMMLTFEEMKQLIVGLKPVKIDELNQRIYCFGIFSQATKKNHSVIFSGKPAERLSNLIESKSKGIFSSLKGSPIWPGIVKGRARILRSPDEIKKIKVGEILVCPMTDPDYMPAIKKAKALVTDQGGVLCHAAIVARELQNVCLVGTQVATNLIKDGDWIEVNADEGIVRKLK